MAVTEQSITERAEALKLMRKAVIYYIADAPEYTRLMDDLTQKCTDAQWEKLERMIEEADEFMADSDIGTLAQKERVFAKREKRRNRYPTCFDDDETRASKIALLVTEYERKGIPYTL